LQVSLEKVDPASAAAAAQGAATNEHMIIASSAPRCQDIVGQGAPARENGALAEQPLRFGRLSDADAQRHARSDSKISNRQKRRSAFFDARG